MEYDHFRIVFNKLDFGSKKLCRKVTSLPGTYNLIGILRSGVLHWFNPLYTGNP